MSVTARCSKHIFLFYLSTVIKFELWQKFECLFQQKCCKTLPDAPWKPHNTKAIESSKFIFSEIPTDQTKRVLESVQQERHNVIYKTEKVEGQTVIELWSNIENHFLFSINFSQANTLQGKERIQIHFCTYFIGIFLTPEINFYLDYEWPIWTLRLSKTCKFAKT